MTITPPALDSLDEHAGRLLDGYAPTGVDEMFDASGAMRDHWGRISQSLSDLGVDELRIRQRESERLLDEDGVTYNMLPRDPGDPPRRSRRWVLDPTPAVLPSDEWAVIERAVI